MQMDRPKFMDSPYFIPEPFNWHLEENAPKELKEEFEEFMKNLNRTEGK